MNRQKIATNKVKKIIRFRKTNSNQKRIVPSVYSNNFRERQLAHSLYGLKHAKRYPGKNGIVFYDNLETVSESLNDANLFEYVERKKIAIRNLQTVLDWISENSRFPKYNKEEQKLYKILENFKYIKSGKLQGIWYSELDDMMKNFGYPEYFKTDVENKMVDCDVDDLLKFYKKNRKVPSQLSIDPEERKLYRKLIRFKQVKKNKTCMIWNPEIDVKIKNMKIKNIFN